MKILIDIGHPAHVHYFKTIIKRMKDEHTFVVTARSREYVAELLKANDIEYVSRGKGKDGFFGKLLYMVFATNFIFWKCFKKTPDLFLSFSSPYAAQAAFLLRRPHIALNDTEHTDKTHGLFTYPFSKAILTPFVYNSDIGPKQIRFKSTMEFFYLTSNVFKVDPSIHEFLDIKSSDKYVVLRFISWSAHHDFGHSGLSIEHKREIISFLKDGFQIFISSEGTLEQEFEQYKIKIPPEKMHDVLANASLFIGESGTMASESAILGTHALFISSLPSMGSLKLAEDAGLLKHFNNGEQVLEYISGLGLGKEFEFDMKSKSQQLQNGFIDPNLFLEWFIEGYPETFRSLQLDERIQDQFRF